MFTSNYSRKRLIRIWDEATLVITYPVTVETPCCIRKRVIKTHRKSCSVIYKCMCFYICVICIKYMVCLSKEMNILSFWIFCKNNFKNHEMWVFFIFVKLRETKWLMTRYFLIKNRHKSNNTNTVANDLDVLFLLNVLVGFWSSIPYRI